MVSQAAKNLESKQKATVSQLSIATGLNRREVTRIYKESDTKAPRVGVTARVISRWQTDKDYTSKNRKPKQLTFDGPQSEFYKLVAEVNRDVHPATVLAELQRVSAVERTAQGLKLVTAHESLKGEPLRAFELLAAEVNSLSISVEENISGNLETQNLQLRTEYDNIFIADLAEIRKKLLALGSRLHREVRELLSDHDKDLNPDRTDPAGGRVILSSFSLIRSDPDNEKSTEIKGKD